MAGDSLSAAFFPVAKGQQSQVSSLQLTQPVPVSLDAPLSPARRPAPHLPQERPDSSVLSAGTQALSPSAASLL